MKINPLNNQPYKTSRQHFGAHIPHCVEEVFRINSNNIKNEFGENSEEYKSYRESIDEMETLCPNLQISWTVMPNLTYIPSRRKHFLEIGEPSGEYIKNVKPLEISYSKYGKDLFAPEKLKIYVLKMKRIDKSRNYQ